jgi:hypothetical protein
MNDSWPLASKPPATQEDWDDLFSTLMQSSDENLLHRLLIHIKVTYGVNSDEFVRFYNFVHS